MKSPQEIVVLCCAQSSWEENAPEPAQSQTDRTLVRSVMIPCGAKVETPNLLAIIEEGADGIEVVLCPEERCQSLVGSRRAARKVERSRYLLDTIGMGAERIGLVRTGQHDKKSLETLAEKRSKIVAELGPHPLKHKGAQRE